MPPVSALTPTTRSCSPHAPRLRCSAQLDASSDTNVRRISANLRTALTTNATTYPTTFQILRESEGTFNGLCAAQ